jgi:hypothetical protein
VNIQNLALPREPRTASPGGSPAHSCKFEEGLLVEILCQKSDVAISVSQTSKIYPAKLQESTSRGNATQVQEKQCPAEIQTNFALALYQGARQKAAHTIARDFPCHT